MYIVLRITRKYLGGIDFMLLSGSSKTLGLASGVTEMYGAGTEVERRYLISSWKRLSSWYPTKFSWWCLHQITFYKLGLKLLKYTYNILLCKYIQTAHIIYHSPNVFKLVGVPVFTQNTLAFQTSELNSNQHRVGITMCYLSIMYFRAKCTFIINVKRYSEIYSETLGKPSLSGFLLTILNSEEHIC